MSKEKYQFIKPLAKKPTLKPKAQVQPNTSKAVQEFIESGLDYAEVSLELSKSGVRGLLIGLNKAIGKDRKEEYEARSTIDGKIVLIRKKKEN